MKMMERYYREKMMTLVFKSLEGEVLGVKIGEELWAEEEEEDR